MFGLTLNSSILRDLKIPSKSKAVKLPTPTADVFADITTGKSHIQHNLISTPVKNNDHSDISDANFKFGVGGGIHSFKTQKHTSHVDRDRQF